MNIAGIVFGVMFSAAGLLFAAGKIHPYISAWKNMPVEDQKKIDIKPLCRNIGEIILLSGIIFLIYGLFPAFQEHWFTGAMIAWLLIAGLDVYFVSKSPRYKKS